jgi:hypothetical protein
VTKASFQLSAVVAAGFREPVAEGVPQVMGAKDPEVAFAVGGLGVVDTAYLPTIVLTDRGKSRPPGRRAAMEDAARNSASLCSSVSPGRSVSR